MASVACFEDKEPQGQIALVKRAIHFSAEMSVNIDRHRFDPDAHRASAEHSDYLLGGESPPFHIRMLSDADRMSEVKRRKARPVPHQRLEGRQRAMFERPHYFWKKVFIRGTIALFNGMFERRL